MSFEIIPTPDFSRSLKVLAKRHRSLKQDMSVFVSSLKENPLQGTEIAPNIRKVRLTITSKGKGKSGGARVITYLMAVSEDAGDVYLIDIYDKSDYDTVDVSVIKKNDCRFGTINGIPCLYQVLKPFVPFAIAV